MLPKGSKLNLEKLTFRQPPKPLFYEEEKLKMLPKLHSIKVIWNIFEAGYSSAIDEGLQMLHLMENVKNIMLEINMINMLYLIQLGPKLMNTSEKIST